MIKKSPFKFLDSYQKEDSNVFFGRLEETEALYDALSGVKHLLVYGPSGAGKTSLIECGLKNQFSDADWFAITIRRGNDIRQSVYAGINEALDDKIELDDTSLLPLDEEIGFGQAIEQLFDETFQPIYLLFDQFEELLLFGEEEEQKAFFTQLNELIRFRVPARVLLIMREEFIGHLSEFEAICPTIFKNRFRLEKMGRSNVLEVVQQTLDAPAYREYFTVDDSQALAEAILAKLPDEKKEIELTHVQVFLNELWDRALASNANTPVPELSERLVKEEDNLEKVLEAFLNKQLEQLSLAYGSKLPLEVLAAMVSKRDTKLQLGIKELESTLANNQVEFQGVLPDLIKNLEENRIIRSIKAGEENRYELSHDLLARVVGQNLTEEIRLREKAADIYRVYLERQGLFAQEDLDYLRPYQQYKPYPSALEERITASTRAIKTREEEALRKAEAQAQKEQQLRAKAEKNAKRATIRTRLASIIAFLALAAAIAAYAFYQQANDSAQTARDALTQSQQNEADRVAQEVDVIISRAIQLRDNGYQDSPVWKNMLSNADSILQEYKENEFLVPKRQEIENLLK